MKCYSAIKRRESTIDETWVDLEDIMLNEINHTEKAKWFHLSIEIHPPPQIINHRNKEQINGWWLSELGVDMGEMSDGGERMWNFQV